MPESMEEKFTRADRDMLVITNSNVIGIKEDMKDLKDNITGRVVALEGKKADESEVNDIIKTRAIAWLAFDVRIKSLETWKAAIIGAFTLIGVIISLITYIYFTEEQHIKDMLTRVEINLNKHIEQTK